MDLSKPDSKGSPIGFAGLDPSLLAKVKGHALFRDVTDQGISDILPFFKLTVLRPGEILTREGISISKELFLILEGNLDVIKTTKDRPTGGGEEFIVANLKAGDVLGELSFIKDIPRSATIRNITRSVILYLDPSHFQEMREKFPEITVVILQNLLGFVSDRLRITTEKQVEVLNSRIEVSQRNAKSNLFFSYIIGLLCAYNLTINLTSQWSTSPTMTSIVSAGMILVFFGVMLRLINASRLPFSMFGLTWNNWKNSLVESLLWTALIMAAMLALKWALITYNPAYEGYSLIQFQPLEPKYLTFNFVLYGLHSPIQEFIVRGVMQGSLQKFLNGKNVTLRAILISNALFTATHVHLFSGPLALAVFLPGLLWGWLYAKQENLVGVSISHILIGWWGLFILSFDTLF